MVTSTTRTVLLDPTVSEPVLLQVPGGESAVQVLKEADAARQTLKYREVRVKITAVPTVGCNDVTVGAAEVNRHQDDGELT